MKKATKKIKMPKKEPPFGRFFWYYIDCCKMIEDVIGSKLPS
jgi:hypothetical protein